MGNLLDLILILFPFEPPKKSLSSLYLKQNVLLLKQISIKNNRTSAFKAPIRYVRGSMLQKRMLQPSIFVYSAGV